MLLFNEISERGLKKTLKDPDISSLWRMELVIYGIS